VSLNVEKGTVHGLVGENGAGKSTLGKIIGGALTPDSGELRIAGRVVHYRAPRDALHNGIALIAQEISLVPERSVIENVFLGAEEHRLGFVRVRSLSERYRALTEDAGFEVPGEARVAALRLADQQKVEILRALSRGAQLIVMDEPTAALTHDEATRLFEIVRRLRQRGTTIVYVSHFLPEVLSLADRVTVMKDGAIVRTSPTSAETPERLVAAMLGRTLDATFPPRPTVREHAPTVLVARELRRRPLLHDVSLHLREGEIVGVAGLVGSGRTELARVLSGADKLESGALELDGRPISLRRPRDAINQGIVLLPESRKSQGLLMSRPVKENMTLPHLESLSKWGVIQARTERGEVKSMMSTLDVRAPGVETNVSSLSGGNQQKVVFGKWLFRMPRVLLADEPTRGVDVGAKRAIYDLITSLAQQGLAVLLISSEFEEVLGLAHRVVVMHGGTIVAQFEGPEITEEEVMQAAFGNVPA
jgi:simple sugar transport system ATP-binding protein/ribose transport system ATP-binding protein